MKEYTFSEARQGFASVLDRARKEGSVRIRRRDGQKFILQPERQSRSPLDVHGIKTDINRDEIIEIIRKSRSTRDRTVKANKSLEPTP